MDSFSAFDLFSFGIFYGIAIAVIFYNLSMYFINQNKSNLFFVLYGISTTIYFISRDSIGLTFIWVADDGFNKTINELSSLLTVFFLLLYASSFLRLKGRYPQIENAIYYFIGFRSIIQMLEVAQIINTSIISYSLDALAFFIAYIFGFLSLKNGFKPAIYFIIGFTGLFLGFIWVESRQIMVTHSVEFQHKIDVGFHYGFIFQLLIQTLALAIRFKTLDKLAEEKEKLEEREKSRNMLMDILDYIPHQIFLKDKNHRLVLINKRVADIYHTTRDKLVGKTDFDLFDEDIAKKYYDEEEAMMAEGKPKIVPEFMHYGKDGNIKIFQSMKLPFYISDIGEQGMLGIEIEITESKLQEKQLIDQNHEIEAQKEQISDLFQEVTDSIKTAKMIQEAIMPPEQTLAEYFQDYFVYYQPKDIVSGDFYWFKYPNHKEKILFATVDCTGHGVAGAFISLIANNLLNKIVDSKIFNTPAEILNKLNDEVMLALNQGPNSQSGSHDGMDITLCILDTQTMELQFAGASSQLCLVRNEQLQVYKTDHFSIGYLNNKRRLFQDFTLNLQENDMLYIYSDGFAGQFGGENGQEKFKYNRLRELLFRISNDNMKDQKMKLKTALTEWMGPHEQTDDVMVLGFKF